MYVSHLNEHRRLQRISDRAREASEVPMPETVRAYLDPEPQSPMTLPAEDGDERRRWNRASPGGEVVVRRLGGFNFQVALHDVSAGGCRVEMVEPSEAGDNVITRLPQLEPLGSIVCWVEGTTTGIQFSTTIHPAVLDLVLTRLAEEAQAA